MKREVVPCAASDVIDVEHLSPDEKHYGYQTEGGAIAKLFRCPNSNEYCFQYISDVKINRNKAYTSAKEAVESIVSHGNRHGSPVWEFDTAEEFFNWAYSARSNWSFNSRRASSKNGTC